MKRINLRDYYPFYKNDCYTEVPDEVAKMYNDFDLGESAYRRRLYRNNAHYSLDMNDGIVFKTLFKVPDMYETYECKQINQQLYIAIGALPEKQARRIYAHFFLGMSKVEIAKAEGITENAVRDAINRALENIKNFLEKNL